MEFTSRTNGTITVLTISGRFDSYEVPNIQPWFDEQTGVKQPRLVVNLAEVDFIDSSALALLVKGLKRCRQGGGDLVICELQKPVQIIFELTRLERAFYIFETQPQAMGYFYA
jgi:anti-sigma B factor antagonist